MNVIKMLPAVAEIVRRAVVCDALTLYLRAVRFHCPKYYLEHLFCVQVSAIFRTFSILPKVYSTLDLNVPSKCTDAALKMGAKNSYYSRSNNLFESCCLNSQAVVNDWDMHSFSAGEKPPQQILFCSWQI